MNDPLQHDTAKTINTWVQTIAILGAAIWALSTFVFKEVLIPKAAPINISLNLQLKKIGAKAVRKADLVAIEMRISATNPSSRTVYLFPTYWIANGYRIAPAVEQDESAVMKAVTEVIKSNQHVYRFANAESATVLAGGALFPDTQLKPGETVARTVVFYAPPDRYDLVDVETAIPTAQDMRGIELAWEVGTDVVLEPKLYRIVGDKRQLIPPEKDGSYFDAKREFQMSRSMAQLSLWQ